MKLEPRIIIRQTILVRGAKILAFSREGGWRLGWFAQTEKSGKKNITAQVWNILITNITDSISDFVSLKITSFWNEILNICQSKHSESQFIIRNVNPYSISNQINIPPLLFKLFLLSKKRRRKKIQKEEEEKKKVSA